MIGNIQLKICGLTSAAHARMAAEIGVDWLGFNLYSKSPRYLSITRFREFQAQLLPDAKSVAVMVEPTPAELAAARLAGFDAFQIHFNASAPLVLLREWSEMVGPSRLWLAPKLPPAEDVRPEWLPLADTFLLDTYHPEKFGGTGTTSDWTKFNRHQAAHPDKTWILSGGLTPENIREALAATGARFVDVNSGVESSPGVKDHAKLRALAMNL
jgi:phosphoribosylanthranilate isomerase